MPDAPQPVTGYDSALGTLQLLFENKAKGHYPSPLIDQLKHISHHFAKHLETAKTKRLSFLDKLRAVTKGSRGYLDDEGNRPEELGKPDAGWYLVYASHVALGPDALAANRFETPAYEGGTWCFNYRHTGPNGSIVEDSVRCTFEGNQREWMKFESVGMCAIYHFARGKDYDDGWMECDGFFTSRHLDNRTKGCWPNEWRGWARAVARFDPNPEARPGSYDIAVFDEEIPHHLVWCYDSNGKVINGKLFLKKRDENRGVFCAYEMIAIDVFQICHDGTGDKTGIADQTLFFDSFEPTVDTKKSMVPFLNAKAKADKKRLECAWLTWPRRTTDSS